MPLQRLSREWNPHFFFTLVTLFESILTLPTLNCITYPSQCAQPLQTYKLKKKVRKSSAKSLDCCFELSEPANLLSTQFKPALASLNNSSSLTWDPSVYFHRGGGGGSVTQHLLHPVFTQKPPTWYFQNVLYKVKMNCFRMTGLHTAVFHYDEWWVSAFTCFLIWNSTTLQSVVKSCDVHLDWNAAYFHTIK